MAQTTVELSPLKAATKRMDYIRERLKDIKVEREKLAAELASLKIELAALKAA